MKTAVLSQNPKSIVVAATFTCEPVGDSLRFWMRELGFTASIRFAPYNQVFQQLLDPAGLMAHNRDGVNIVLVRLHDWAQAGLDGNLEHFVASVKSAARFPAPLLVCLCPDTAANERAAERLRGELNTLPGVHFLSPGDVARAYPVENCHDPHADELGHVPYTPACFTALGSAAARRIRALWAPPYKVIVLDCDETLWAGICGEDGPTGIEIDPPRRALQEFMLAQRRAGMLLALASKNNEEDVVETFRLHLEMPLSLEDFVARRINWESKSANLLSLADELDLGLDSLILVDDNPKECAEVDANCPEVLTLLLPERAEEIPRFLEHVWAFDRWKVTSEDLARPVLYAQRAERQRVERQAATLEEFLAALRLEVRIEPFESSQAARVAQLSRRTNQMNFTTVRRSEGEVLSLVASGEAECMTVHVSDRFGSYGLVGVIIFSEVENALRLETFLLSCRALGRGVEHRMLARLGSLASERGLGFVEAPYLATARNRLSLDFLRAAGAEHEIEIESELLFRFPAETLRRLEYKPGAVCTSAPSEIRAAQPACKPADFGRIARELNHVEAILAACAPRPALVAAASRSEPRTELERQLTEIWQRMLHAEHIGVHDGFFDLGGHSLLAVQLLSEVRQRFSVDLSLQVVYGGAFTVAERAKAIELSEVERAGATGYSDLLDEIDRLSDDEVRALLAQEQGGDA